MTNDKFVLQFDGSEIPKLAAQYIQLDQGEDEKALKAGNKILSGDYSLENLAIIFRWKTGGRGVSRLRRNSDTELADTLRLVANAATERAAVAVLCGLFGVEVPVASAILTAIKPEAYTIIDFRALESLGINKRQSYYTIDYYLGYLRKCRELAHQSNVDLRTLDRALWQWSKNRHKQ